ncbi:MAG TPA: META domain-containing protein [Anaerolineaceae bacterium]|nr:META domain-containing protein [Anaerolineaceae bacterium]
MQVKQRITYGLIGLLLLLVAACAPAGEQTPSPGALEPGAAGTPSPAAEETAGGQTPAAGKDPLAGSEWLLVSFAEAGTETPVIEGSTLTLAFEAGGQAVGEGGCNSFGASYALEGDSLSFEPVTSTLIACEDEDVMQQETDYFAALGEVSRYESSDDQLTLLAGDQPVLRFERP